VAAPTQIAYAAPAESGNLSAKELPAAEHFDVLIVGAGLSGIGAACHLQRECPSKTFAILESRQVIGGTWDLFRYPGVRSDSDMYTLGYRFRPWRQPKSIVDGPSILKYIRETAREDGIDRKIRFGHRATFASWSSESAFWTIQATGPDGASLRFTAKFLFICSGYYDYDAGYLPGWAGMERFHGRIIHPQQWPEYLDYRGQRVVVIGSGATAVTLVPALAESAAHVTMLQRSPSYIVARPSRDAVANALRRLIGARLAYSFARWKNVLFGIYFYNLARRKPDKTKKGILQLAQKELGPAYEEKHLSPRYNPWDQRLCLIPDADLFASIRSGKVSLVTDEIETFTEKGLRLKSGQELEADIIITATGLKLKVLGGMQLRVDGAPVNIAQTLSYKGVMYSGIPNLASTFGYINASWTLKADLIAEYICRLLKQMDARGYDFCTPRRRDSTIVEEPALSNFTSGYIQRANHILPKQGSKKPWRLRQNYALDLFDLRFGKIEDGTMEFTRLEKAPRAV